LTAGVRDFMFTHVYADSNPADTGYTINFFMTDDDGGTEFASVMPMHKNIAPEITDLSVTSMINEDGTVTLSGSFTDPNVLDTFTLDIDWGPGESSDSISLGVGTRDFMVTHQYLDDNPTITTQDSYTITATVTDDEGDSDTEMTSTLVKNVDPLFTSLSVTPMIDENGMVTLSGMFTDPGTLDTYTLVVDWGLGETSDTIMLAAGVRDFSIMHQYLDDNPTLTTQDDYTIMVTLTDDDSGDDIASVETTVKNVDPLFTSLSVTPMIDENGVVTLSGMFTDPGTLDTYTLVVDWGPGETSDTISLAAGVRDFSVMHQYLDDNPSITPQDDYTIMVTLTDDDSGDDIASVETTVKNVDPLFTAISVTPMIDENGIVTLSGTFTDPGTLDTYSLVVDWGPGETSDTIMLAAGVRDFSIMHQYLDDNPSITSQDDYTIMVTLTDDDSGDDIASVETTVKNVAPVFTSLSVTPMVDENGIVTLSGTFTDPGTLDTYSLVVDWGLGETSDTITLAAGVRDFMVTHQYLDDNPSITPQDDYTIMVTLTDDDSGDDIASVMTTVKNVDPLFTAINVTPMIDENGIVTLSGTFTDPGTLDTYSLVVDWGLGETSDTITLAAGVRDFMLTHQYKDDNPTVTMQDDYTIGLTLTDDDSGDDLAAVMTTVKNVAPTLEVVDRMVDEGSLLTLLDLAAYTDVGMFDTHTATVNWGDGSATEAAIVTGGMGAGSVSGSHTFADNGVYTVTVTVTDDDSGVSIETFEITVKNVDPTLVVVGDQMAVETVLLSLTDLGVITDPGYDNPDNPLMPPSGSVERFFFTIDWGDGTAPDMGMAMMDLIGSEGVLSAASFNGAHTYASDGVFTVIVMVVDDDGGTASGSFLVTVDNFPIFIPPVVTPPTPPNTNNPNAGAPPVISALGFENQSSRNVQTQQFETGESRGSSSLPDVRKALGDLVATSEKRFLLREVFPNGTEGESIPLQDDAVNDLPVLYSKLPDGHYRIYQLREDGTLRLVADEHIVNGRPVDPNEQGGSQDRPPTSSILPSGDQQVAQHQPEVLQQETPAEQAEVIVIEQFQSRVSRRLLAGLSVAGATAIAGSDRGSWQSRMDRAMQGYRKRPGTKASRLVRTKLPR